jgi:hypothetical protein
MWDFKPPSTVLQVAMYELNGSGISIEEMQLLAS